MRVVCFTILFLIGLLMPFWVFLLCCIAYTFYWRAYELIVIGVLIDAQFGIDSATFAYLYTASISGCILFAELVKPRIIFYTA